MVRLLQPAYFGGVLHPTGEVVQIYGDPEMEVRLLAAGNAERVGVCIEEMEAPPPPPPSSQVGPEGGGELPVNPVDEIEPPTDPMASEEAPANPDGGGNPPITQAEGEVPQQNDQQVLGQALGRGLGKK